MRIRLLTIAAVLFGCGNVYAADPPIVFQTHPVGQVLDELRAAADLIGGEKGVKALNKNIKDSLGEKGFEGLDISRPIFGYVILAPKPEDITAVVALPITQEKEFLDLCERANHEKPKLLEKEKDIYRLPPLDWRYKALLRFSNQYAYIAYGAKPAPAIDLKALIPIQQIYNPAETGLVAAHFYFDRVPLAVKLALPALMEEVKKTIMGGWFFGRDEQQVAKAVLREVEKLIERYLKLAAGADKLSARISLDIPMGNLVVESTLNGKPGSELSQIIAARKPTGNKFGGLIAAPDMVAGFKVRLPLFEQEIRDATIAGLEAGEKQNARFIDQGAKPLLEEIFKGLKRTVKTGEFDIVAGVRGPDKNGSYTGVGAIAFEDTAVLEKEFKKFIENTAPPKILEGFTWDAAKAGSVNIHTYKSAGGLLGLEKGFGDENCEVAFAFAPHGVFLVIGPEAVKTMKDALTVKPAVSPVLDIVINPARVVKFFAKYEEPRDRPRVNLETVLGKEDKVMSAMSMTVEGGKELKVTYTINLRLIPRAAAYEDLQQEDQPKTEGTDVESKKKEIKKQNR